MRTRLPSQLFACGVLVGALLVGGPAAGAREALDEFGCRFTVVVDYTRQFEKMKPIPRIPRSGKLPFGPRWLRAGVVGGGASSGGGAIGLEISLPSLSNGRPRPLNWTVLSELAVVDRGGVPRALLRSKRSQVKSLGGKEGSEAEFLFHVLKKPRFYRVESTFLDSSGAVLGKIAAYFRVLRRHVEVRASLRKTILHPGDDLIATLENRGTTVIDFGEEFSIERFEDGQWRLDPVTPHGFITVGFTMGAGSGYECRELRLPDDMAPGHYRYRKPVGIARRRERDVVAEFYVTP